MIPRPKRSLPLSFWTIAAVVLSACLSLSLLPGVAAPPDAPAAKAAPAYAGRLDEDRRAKLLKEGGGNEASEAAVAAGLKWLSRHQAKDGHWGLHDFKAAGRCSCGDPGQQNDAAGTGLALLPFLAHGETPKGEGPYAKVVKNGLAWLIAHQGKDGLLGTGGYSHPICTIALCEAYGLTGDAALKKPAEKALAACVDWQHEDGGFRYNRRMQGDTSVTSWFVQAIKSGQRAQLNVPQATFTQVNKYLDSVQAADGSRYIYILGGETTPTMSAAGLLSRQSLGWGPKASGVVKGVENLQKMPPLKTTRNMYYYYYATQVVHNAGGEAWEKWNKDMRDLLIDEIDGGETKGKADQKGSWSPQGEKFGDAMGRLGYTSLALLTLEVYYRHEIEDAAPPKEKE